MSKPSQFIVLSEDQRQQVFVRHYLKCKFPGCSGLISNEPLPSGQGSGEQFVRQRYVENVEAYRVRATRARTVLIVAIDADKGTVEKRIQQLREALTEAGLPARRPEEKIVHLVPKRNIETWVLCLNGEGVNEESDYHDLKGVNEQIKPAALTLFDWSRQGAAIPGNCVESLRGAIAEVRRLE